MTGELGSVVECECLQKRSIFILEHLTDPTHHGPASLVGHLAYSHVTAATVDGSDQIPAVVCSNNQIQLPSLPVAFEPPRIEGRLEIGTRLGILLPRTPSFLERYRRPFSSHGTPMRVIGLQAIEIVVDRLPADDRFPCFLLEAFR